MTCHMKYGSPFTLPAVNFNPDKKIYCQEGKRVRQGAENGVIISVDVRNEENWSTFGHSVKEM